MVRPASQLNRKTQVLLQRTLYELLYTPTEHHSIIGKDFIKRNIALPGHSHWRMNTITPRQEGLVFTERRAQQCMPLPSIY